MTKAFDKIEKGLNEAIDYAEDDSLFRDLLELRDSFESRYKSLSLLKNRAYQAKTAKRAYLDVNKLCKKYGG